MIFPPFREVTLHYETLLEYTQRSKIFVIFEFYSLGFYCMDFTTFDHGLCLRFAAGAGQTWFSSDKTCFWPDKYLERHILIKFNLLEA